MLKNVINFLIQVKEQKLATDVLEAFVKNSNSFEQLDKLSEIYFKIKNYEKAIECGEKAYAIASSPEQMYVIRHNLINIYNHANYPEKALRYIRANEAVIESDIDRDFEKAYSLFLSNRKSEAAELLRSKLMEPNLSEEQATKLNFNLGTYDLLDGNLQQGLKRFLLNGEQLGIWDNTTFFNQHCENYGLQKWNGIVKAKLNLLIIAEAGIGDEVINVRFVSYLKKLGITPIWLTLPTRKDLAYIYNLNGIEAYSSIKDIPIEFLQTACYVPSMHLPIYLNCGFKNLWKGHYLPKIDEDYDKKWKEVLAPYKHKKIGLRWQGNPEYDQDLHRSIPLVEIVKRIPSNTNLISVQRDTGLEQLLDSEEDIVDMSSKLETLNDLSGCLNNLDLLITSCTSVAHIAAAMGKQVCIIVPISCYYVWCHPFEKTPWYGDNVHVFYQKTPRSWEEPLQELEEFLVNNL